MHEQNLHAQSHALKKDSRSKTVVLSKVNTEQLATLDNDFGFSLSIKIPDGSFKGVYKVESPKELKKVTDDLIKNSTPSRAGVFLYRF